MRTLLKRTLAAAYLACSHLPPCSNSGSCASNRFAGCDGARWRPLRLAGAGLPWRPAHLQSCMRPHSAAMGPSRHRAGIVDAGMLSAHPRNCVRKGVSCVHLCLCICIILCARRGSVAEPRSRAGGGRVCVCVCCVCCSGLYMTRLRVMDQTQLTGSVSRVDSTHRRCESS
jgi:hypothetical protein